MDRKGIRIVGMMVCGAEADRYLEASLKELKRLCNDAIIATNNADQKTKDLIKKYGFWQYEDNREWGIHQPDIKTDLLRRVGKLKPDWIVALDADEVFAPEFTREEAEKLTEQKEIAFYFMIVNLYNDKDHFYHGAGIQRFWNIRFFKYLSDHIQYMKKSLHCGLAPPVFYHKGWHAPFYVEHYGLMSKKDRIAKVERYREFDPNAKFKNREYYDDLEADHEPMVFDKKGLLNKLASIQDTQPRK